MAPECLFACEKPRVKRVKFQSPPWPNRMRPECRRTSGRLALTAREQSSRRVQGGIAGFASVGARHFPLFMGRGKS